MKASLPAEKKMRSSVNAVVIGGGIAGVCCAQELVRLCTDNVILVSSSDTLVESASIFSITNHLDEIAVYERKTDQFQFNNPNITIRKGYVASVDFLAKEIKLEDGSIIEYSKLCICSGVRPKLIAEHELVLGLRDLNSLEILTMKLSSARRVAIVGNGGISLELIHELRNINVDWIIKDKYIGSVFFDASASAFILPSLLERASESSSERTSTVSNVVSSNNTSHASGYSGYGLGPEWVTKFGFLKSKEGSSSSSSSDSSSGSLTMHCEQQVLAISSDHGATWQYLLDNSACSAREEDHSAHKDFPLLIRTTAGEVFGVDFIISATGVQPNLDFISPSSSGGNNVVPTLSADGCLVVNDMMETSIPGVFSAGDCCSFQGKNASDLYFQMKLWTQVCTAIQVCVANIIPCQARSMGVYAAQCMCECSDQYGLDAQFDLFTHITRFFGFKVVMLGRYNGQGLDEQTEKVTKQMVVTSEGLERNQWFSGDQYSSSSGSASTDAEVEFWLRVTPGVEYIKLVVLRGKVIGALLIGNTELEEVFENLILNRLDVSQLGVGLLDPDIDIADYFD